MFISETNVNQTVDLLVKDSRPNVAALYYYTLKSKGTYF